MAAQHHSRNNQQRDFAVAVIGVEQKELTGLERVFSITRYRSRCYSLISIDTQMAFESIVQSASKADILVVNVNNPKAIILWSRLAAALHIDHKQPVIRISRAKPSEDKKDLTITYPVNPAKTLNLLDNYTIKYLDFIPELKIGNESDMDSPCLQNIESICARKPVSKSSARVRVLVADDSLAVRRQLQMEFSMIGSDLDAVENGDAAIRAAEKSLYDIIFLDVVMPGADGYTVCKQIRKSAQNRNTPVVLLTSKSSKFDKLKGMLAGCDTYLTKPINHNEFTEVTRKHLENNGVANQ